MANNGQAGASNLFLPLVGQEHASRLEEKYDYYLDSDDENDPIYNAIHEKTPKQNHVVNSPTEWLNSQRKPSAFIPYVGGKQRLCQKQRRSSPLGRPEPANKQQQHEKCLLLPGTSRKNKKDIHSDRELEVEAPCTDSVSRLSSENTREVELTEGWNDGDQTDAYWGTPLNDSERPKLAIMPLSEKVEFRLSADDSEHPVVVPATINQYLRDYQREGIRFLYQHYIAKTGAILGDDMGLGKTIQVIGFLSALLGKQGNRMDTVYNIPKFIRQMSDDLPNSPPKRSCKPFLIIGPSAVMYNWLDELKTWGYFTASKFHGADKETCLENLKKQKLEIVVTTFETCRDNIARLNQVEWEVVIVDEVHKIKGLKAQVTQTLRTINTPCRFGLTGTALQNNMTELWSLLDWVQPGVLGTLEKFEREFVEVIELGQRRDATKRELAQARKQKDKFSEFRKRMLLRRTKALIADQLPTKEDLVVMCRLSDVQNSVYRAILTHPDMKLVLTSEDPCDCRSRKVRASCCYKFTSNGIKVWTLVFSFMHLMLKAANHMALLIPDKNTKEKQASLAKSVFKIAFKDHPQFIEQTRLAAFRTLSDPKYCGKMKVLQGLLSAFYTNHDKVLIFSYSTRLLDIIEQYVISQGHEYRRIDGKVSSQHRQNIVTQFNTDSSIFICLISTKAGGLGLNLTGANKVVIFDPNWNPSHDLQAQDRAYRIGQTRDVNVYRLVSAGTIEENIYLRQIYKQQLDEVAIGTSNARRYFHGIQGDKGHRGELFGIKNMFSHRTGDTCLTMDILKRNDKLERGLAGYDITHYVPPNEVPTTNSTESGEESSEIDDMCLVGSDAEEEEDEEFLRQIFGSERTPILSKDEQSLNKYPSEALFSDDYQHPLKSQNILNKTFPNVESDSDDGEISLIPKLHKKPQNIASITEKRRILTFDIPTSLSDGCINHNSPLPGAKDGIFHPDKFSVSDITFSSRIGETSSGLLQQRSNQPETRKRGAVSGISWLFSDSDEDEKGEQIVESDDLDTMKCPANFSNKKCRMFATDESVPEECQSSTNTVRGNIKPTKNSSPEKHKGCIESSTAARVQSGTAKENVSLEQLVLKGSDILHTHMNAKIVGSSRAEDHMTRCAIEDVFELHTNSQAPAQQCDPYSQDEESDSANKKSSKGRNRPKNDHNTVKCVSSGSFKILVGQTPASIKRQQWSDFCEFMGVDQRALAETLVTADVERKLTMLKEFYSQKHPHLTEVLAQVFSFKQAGHSSSKDQKTNRPKRSSRNKLINSVHTDKNPSTDDSAFSDPTDERSHKDPEYPSRSKSKLKQHKPAAVSKLLTKNYSSSQSEDSVTAFPPEQQESHSDSSHDNFLPIPPSSSRKASSSVHILPCRSKTRLRTKVTVHSSGDYWIKDKHFAFGAPNIDTNPTHQYSVDGTLVDISASNKHGNVETLANVAENKTLMKHSEDITSLLHDMGQKSSELRTDERKNNKKSSTLNEKCKCLIACETKGCASSHSAQDTAVIDLLTTAKEKTSKSKSGTIKQAVIAGGGKIACMLDDIFSSCQKPGEKTDFSGKNRYPSTRLSARPNDEASNSKYSELSSSSSKVTGEGLLSETDSVFDDLLRTSTLKDERVYSFVRSNKKKDLQKKVKTTSTKHELETNEDKRLAIDIDDLSWCKFDTGTTSSKSKDGSWSLFS